MDMLESRIYLVLCIKYKYIYYLFFYDRSDRYLKCALALFQKLNIDCMRLYNQIIPKMHYTIMNADENRIIEMGNRYVNICNHYEKIIGLYDKYDTMRQKIKSLRDILRDKRVRVNYQIPDIEPIQLLRIRYETFSYVVNQMKKVQTILESYI